MKRALLCTESYRYLMDELAELGAGVPLNWSRDFFKDGERHIEFHDSLIERDVVLIGGTISDADTMELLSLAIGVVENFAERLTIVIPYFGYSTMERGKPGEVVMAKVMAILLSAIPQAPRGTRIVLMDIHSEGIPHYFDSQTRTTHLYCQPVVLEMIQAAMIESNSVPGKVKVGATDQGRGKWVETYAKALRLRAASLIKDRHGDGDSEITGIVGDVDGWSVVIYDDMGRTLGTAAPAGEAYIEHGATVLALILTHAVFPGNALSDFLAKGIIPLVLVTNTHPNAYRREQDEHYAVFSVAPLIAEHLNKFNPI